MGNNLISNESIINRMETKCQKYSNISPISTLREHFNNHDTNFNPLIYKETISLIPNPKNDLILCYVFIITLIMITITIYIKYKNITE